MVTKRSNLLDIIKGLMIIFIIVTHFHFRYPEDYQRFGFFFWIDMAVPVFMIITGYLTAISFDKKKISSVKEALSLEIVIPKLLRFCIPFIIVYLAEVLLFPENRSSFEQVLSTFLWGGMDQVLITHQL